MWKARRLSKITKIKQNRQTRFQWCHFSLRKVSFYHKWRNWARFCESNPALVRCFAASANSTWTCIPRLEKVAGLSWPSQTSKRRVSRDRKCDSWYRFRAGHKELRVIQLGYPKINWWGCNWRLTKLVCLLFFWRLHGITWNSVARPPLNNRQALLLQRFWPVSKSHPSSQRLVPLAGRERHKVRDDRQPGLAADKA